MKNTGYTPRNKKTAEETLLELGGMIVGKRKASQKSDKSFDVSLTVGKKTDKICVTIRNRYEAEFGEFMSFVVLENVLYMFTPSGKNLPQCKIVREERKSGEIHAYIFPRKDMTDGLRAFEGDHELQYDKKVGAYYIELSEEGE